MTCYSGVSGTANNNPRWPNCDGILYCRSKTRLTDIADGTSTTLMVGQPTRWPRTEAGGGGTRQSCRCPSTYKSAGALNWDMAFVANQQQRIWGPAPIHRYE